MFLDISYAVGVEVTAGIIALAELLTKSDSSPGLIATALVVATITLGTWYFLRTRRQLKAVRLLDQKIRSFEDIQAFADGFDEFKHDLTAEYRRPGPREAIWEAWDEFSETIVPDDLDGPLRMRNSIRPASFLNVEDLGFGPAVRGGSVCLNSYGAFSKWISALVMPLPLRAPAG